MIRQTHLAKSRLRNLYRGFTLVELLVVIAIIGILVALLLPAIQAARETARRISCTNNLKQLMLGFHSHLDAKRAFPPARIAITGKQHGWVVDLLPYLEENGLHSIYRRDRGFFAVENEAAVKMPIAITMCPSVPVSQGDRVYPLTTASGQPYTTSGAAADYSVAYYLDAVTANSAGLSCSPNCNVSTGGFAPVLYSGGGEENKLHPIKKITDGLSHTILICEQAGRPEHFVFGTLQPNTNNLIFPKWWMAWASDRAFVFQGYDASGLAPGATCAVNCNNSQGIAGLHPGGAMVTFCDGSVHFLSDDVSTRVVFELFTRGRGEQVNLSEAGL